MKAPKTLKTEETNQIVNVEGKEGSATCRATSKGGLTLQRDLIIPFDRSFTDHLIFNIHGTLLKDGQTVLLPFSSRIQRIRRHLRPYMNKHLRNSLRRASDSISSRYPLFGKYEVFQ